MTNYTIVGSLAGITPMDSESNRTVLSDTKINRDRCIFIEYYFVLKVNKDTKQQYKTQEVCMYSHMYLCF